MCFEVEIIKSYMKENLTDKKQLKMFLDIHAHSNKRSIFCYAPKPEKGTETVSSKTLPGILDEMSEMFSLKNSDCNNLESKKYSARLGIHNIYKLMDSYTVEASCFGYDVKNNPMQERSTQQGSDNSPEIVQFKPAHFIQFGETLAMAIARQLDLNIFEEDNDTNLLGYEIDLDFGLGGNHKNTHRAEDYLLRKNYGVGSQAGSEEISEEG